MAALLIIAGVAAFYFWMGGSEYRPITDPTKITLSEGGEGHYEWREYQTVGTTSDGVEIIVEAEWRIESRHEERQSDSITVTRDGFYSNGQPFKVGDIITVWSKVWVAGVEIEPTPDRWAFRASQIAGGVVSPFYGKTDSTTNRFNDLQRSEWGVPFADALAGAESRLTSSGGVGDIDPTADGNTQPTDLDLDANGFPQQGMDSFTGMPMDLNESIDLQGSTSIATRGLTSTDELGLI